MAEITLDALGRTNKRLQRLTDSPFDDATKVEVFNEILKMEGINEQEHAELISDLRVSGGQEAFLNPMLSEVGQGLSLGSLDEGIGAVAGAQAGAANRAQMGVFQQQNPVASLVGQGVGALALNALPGAGLIGSTATALQKGGKIGALASGAVRGAGAGLLEGAIAGHNMARGEFLGPQRRQGAILGGAVGAGAGLAGGAFANLLRRQTRGAGPKAIAADQAERELQRAGLRAEDITPGIDRIRARTGGAEGMVADLSPELQKTSRALAAVSPEIRAKAIPRLRERDFGTNKRLAAMLKVSFKRSGSEDFDDFLTKRMNAAFERTKPLYDASLPMPVQLNATQRAILAQKDIKNLVKNKASLFDKDLRTPNVYDADGNVRANLNLTVRDIHAIQQAIADKARSTSVKGAKGSTGKFWDMRNRLMESARDATRQPDGSSLYEDATEIFAGEVQLTQAAHDGFNFMKDRPGQIRKRLSRMSKGEKKAYQVGALEAMVDMIDAPRDTQNTALRLLQSPKARKRVRELFDNDEQFDELLTGVDQEMDLRNTLDQTTGGSSTAQTTEDIARLREETVGVDPDVAGTFDVATAVSKPKQSIFAIRRLFQKGGEKLFGAGRQSRFSRSMDELGDVFFTQGRAENAEIQAMMLARQKRNRITDITGRMIRGIPGAAAVTVPQTFEGPFGGTP